MKNQFHSPSLGKMNLTRVVQEILAFMELEQKEKYDIVVGTDSEGNGKVDFVTAIVVHRIGRGGRYFWKREFKNGINHLRPKIYQETTFSLETAQELLSRLKKHWENGNGNGNPSNYNLEIHVDIGENGKTRDMIKEVVGMVRGNGFNVKTKPESYGASNVADKHV